MASETTKEDKPSATYPAGCHCGYIRFEVTLSPPFPEYKILECGCSICRRAGYLLVYPKKDEVKWIGDSKARCAVYQFNTKQKDQLFCPRCGVSIGIDFRDVRDGYGISARTIDGLDLRTMNYEIGDGLNRVHPAKDLSAPYQEE